MTRATGTFEVKTLPLDPWAEAALGRFSLDKQYAGDLTATSKGEMLACMTEVKGSAGYVAIERVSGTLGGRTGGFALQHYGLMNRGDKQQLTVTVVPDSGTGELAGLSGTLEIQVESGRHTYTFDYSL